MYKNPQSNDNPNTFVSHCTSLWNWHNPTFLSVCLEFVDFTVPLVNRRSSGNKVSLRYSQHNINVTRSIDCTLPRLTFSKYLQNPDNPRPATTSGILNASSIIWARVATNNGRLLITYLYTSKTVQHAYVWIISITVKIVQGRRHSVLSDVFVFFLDHCSK